MKASALVKDTTKAKAAKKKKPRTTSKASKKTTKHKAKAVKHSAHYLHEKHLEHEHTEHVAHDAHEVHIGKLSIGDVSCCTAEALAASLRLTGRPVADEDVLALYWRTASDPDAGASIEATLRAAAEHGLAGYRPRWFGLATIAPFGCRRSLPSADGPGYRQRYGAVRAPQVDRSYQGPLLVHVELDAGPHTLLTDPSGRGVWSWGALHELAELEAGPALESWAVMWS